MKKLELANSQISDPVYKKAEEFFEKTEVFDKIYASSLAVIVEYELNKLGFTLYEFRVGEEI